MSNKLSIKKHFWISLGLSVMTCLSIGGLFYKSSRVLKHHVSQNQTETAKNALSLFSQNLYSQVGRLEDQVGLMGLALKQELEELPKNPSIDAISNIAKNFQNEIFFNQTNILSFSLFEVKNNKTFSAPIVQATLEGYTPLKDKINFFPKNTIELVPTNTSITYIKVSIPLFSENNPLNLKRYYVVAYTKIPKTISIPPYFKIYAENKNFPTPLLLSTQSEENSSESSSIKYSKNSLENTLTPSYDLISEYLGSKLVIYQNPSQKIEKASIDPFLKFSLKMLVITLLVIWIFFVTRTIYLHFYLRKQTLYTVEDSLTAEALKRFAELKSEKIPTKSPEKLNVEKFNSQLKNSLESFRNREKDSNSTLPPEFPQEKKKTPPTWPPTVH